VPCLPAVKQQHEKEAPVFITSTFKAAKTIVAPEIVPPLVVTECQFLQMVTERDKALRSAVLGTLAVLYQQEGEATVWAQCGRLSDQQKSLIEVRARPTSFYHDSCFSSSFSTHSGQPGVWRGNIVDKKGKREVAKNAILIR